MGLKCNREDPDVEQGAEGGVTVEGLSAGSGRREGQAGVSVLREAGTGQEQIPPEIPEGTQPCGFLSDF